MEHHRFSLQEGLINIDQWKGHSVGYILFFLFSCHLYVSSLGMITCYITQEQSEYSWR